MPGQNFGSFTERVALVVGGGQGIGRAVALQLALQGAYVIVNYAPADVEGGRVVGELREIGTLAHAAEGDVSRAADVSCIFNVVEETFGRLDLLVNSVCASGQTPLDALTEESWAEVLETTLKGAFLCSQAAARLMLKRPSPAIVNIASEAGLTGRGGVNHVAAQAGVIGLTKALARELAPRIRVNCVAVAERSRAGQSEKRMIGETGIPPVRTPTPDEAARACVYLLSSEANSITGETLVVGGRWV